MNALNNKQKTGLWVGIAMALAMGVFPPWVEGGSGGPLGSYSAIFAPPASEPGHPPMQIDYSRLLVQWAMAGMVAVGLVMTAQEGAQGGEPGKPTIPTKPSSQAGQVVHTQPAVAPVSAAPVKRLKFPDGQSLGDVLVESNDDPDYWDWIASAQGLVEVPATGRLQLDIRKDEHPELGALGRSEMSAIVSVDASDSKLTDDDVMLIAALKNLQELDLTNTSVTNAGLQHLSRLRSLEKLWLDGTKVTDEGLALIKELPSLKKVSFANTPVTDSSVLSLKEGTKDCQFVLSNGKNV